MMKIKIPYKPREIQKGIHKELETHRFNVVVAHRRLGKTVMVINQLIKKAMKNVMLNPRYGYVAPLYSQAKLIAWDYLKLYTSTIPGVKRNESELWIELPNGARIKLFGADNPDSLRGMYFDGVVLDEYADMKSTVWNEVIRPALSDRNGFAIFIGTPRGLDQFYEIYQKALREDEWYAGIFPVDKTNVLSDDEIKSASAMMTENAVKQEFYCDFTASNDDIFVPLDIVGPAMGRIIHETQILHAPKILSVDVARFGDDDTEIWIRQGLKAWHVRTIKKQDTMAVASQVAVQINEKDPDATFIDAVGIGAGVVDRLKQLGFDVIGVNSGTSPSDPSLYYNKRAEMWGDMKQWLMDGGCIPDDAELASEISTPFYMFDKANRIKLEKKEDIKKRGFKSPNKADALSYTFYMPVIKETLADIFPTYRRNQTARGIDYDPLEI